LKQTHIQHRWETGWARDKLISCVADGLRSASYKF